MPATHTDQTPTGYTVRLNTHAWFAIRKARRLDVDVTIARHMGVTAHTVARVQSGKVAPSPAFIGGALAALDFPPNAVGTDPRCLFVVAAAVTA